jgi:hypothetical protein
MNTRLIILLKLLGTASLLTLGGCLGSEEESGFVDDSGSSTGPSNRAPTISGSPPPAVKVGDSYSFTPSASDPDGDSLTFTIENKPNWLSFSSSNGRISGTPTLGNIGTFSNIRIAVSDGQASSSLSAFSINVTQVATASATLSWTAPTLNEDGTSLTDLAGYKLYYGTSSRDYTNSITIDNPSITTYLVDNLTPDTYYFAATAFNLSGVESRYSGEAVKTLN